MIYKVDKHTCTYTTLDGKYSIKKNHVVGTYSIYSFIEHNYLQQEQFYKNSIGKLSFGRLKDAKEFLEEHFYKEVI